MVPSLPRKSGLWGGQAATLAFLAALAALASGGEGGEAAVAAPRKMPR